jgi:hypothetical protein
VVVLVAATSWGCMPTGVMLSPTSRSTDEIAEVYDDRDWATVLRENVRDGLVDYEHLAAHPEPLEDFLAHIKSVGPESKPDLFADRRARLAYYANAYNAGALKAVLHAQLPETMYPEGQPSLDHRYRLMVDGRPMTLHQVREAAREESQGDARIEFAFCGAALGSPPIYDQPFRRDTIERTLGKLARSAMDNPRLVRIDHQGQRLVVGLPVVDQREAFLLYYRQLSGVRRPTLLNVLLHMAGDVRREWLNTAVGYKEATIPFDRSLNRWPPD